VHHSKLAALRERKLLKHHETELCSSSHRFGPTVRTEFSENGGDVVGMASARRRGPRTASIDPDGPAARAGLLVGDIVTTWNAKPALRGRAERQIKADKTVDGSTAKTVPSRSRDGDDAEASDWRTFVISECQDDVTRT
jgi:C-terminal processing protease CtpA/Prc